MSTFAGMTVGYRTPICMELDLETSPNLDSLTTFQNTLLKHPKRQPAGMWLFPSIFIELMDLLELPGLV